MYYSYDYSTIPHPPEYWLMPCPECGEDYYPKNPHDHSEPLPEEPDDNLIPEGDVRDPQDGRT